MVWTAPRTWVNGEIETETIFNTHVRDNLLALRPSAAIGVRENVQSIDYSSLTAVEMDREIYDDGDYIDLVTSVYNITFPKTGIYSICAWATFAANTTGVRELYSYVNDVVNERNRIAAVASSPFEATTTVFLNTITQRTAADYMEFRVAQTSGGPLNLTYFKAAVCLLKDLST